MNKCEPTTHRGVRRVILPPPHHPSECQPEPTLSTPTGGGSSLPPPLGALPGSDNRGPCSSSAAPVSPPIREVSRVVTGTDSRTQLAEDQ